MGQDAPGPERARSCGQRGWPARSRGLDTVLRLALKDVHSLYHALFIVGPIANVVEIWHDRRVKARRAAGAGPATQAPVLVVARG